MTLAQRLALAIGVVTVLTTTVLGFGVREAWRSAEEDVFREQFDGAIQRLKSELVAQGGELAKVVEPLCRFDPIVDSALLDLRKGRLDPEARLRLRLNVPSLMKGRSLDEFALVTHAGEVLASGNPGEAGRNDPELARRMLKPSKGTRLRAGNGPLALETYCRKRDGDVWVGVVAARHVDPLLQEVAATHGLTLSLEEPVDGSDSMVRAVQLAELDGLRVVATQSRLPLRRQLRQLDTTVLVIGVGVFCLGLVLAYLLARGLAGPIESLARQTRAVVAGEPKPVRVRGARELVELSEAFNRAIADLTAMRKRLAATERIAARREIARRVAHEIKNPLAPIRASVETLRRLRARDDPAFDDYFDEATRTVLDEVARITNIVGEFTRFARLPPPDPAPMDIVQAARKVKSLHDGVDGGVRVELDADSCPKINADHDQMVQVLTNLVQNAADAASLETDPRVDITVRAAGEDHVEIRVADNGPGFAPEIRDKLFEPYATTKPEGTGLGLAIVQRIVFEHAGEISADEADRGAVFTVRLPVAGPSLLTHPPASTPLNPKPKLD